MQGAHGEHFRGYNVPVAAAAQHGLIAGDDVVPAANDRQQLAPLATAAQAELQVATLAATADKGSHQAEPLAACAAAGITAYAPAPATAGNGADGVILAVQMAPEAPRRCSGPGRRGVAITWPTRWNGVPGTYLGRPPRPLSRRRSFHTVCEAGCQ